MTLTMKSTSEAHRIAVRLACGGSGSPGEVLTREGSWCGAHSWGGLQGGSSSVTVKTSNPRFSKKDYENHEYQNFAHVPETVTHTPVFLFGEKRCAKQAVLPDKPLKPCRLCHALQATLRDSGSTFRRCRGYIPLRMENQNMANEMKATIWFRIEGSSNRSRYECMATMSDYVYSSKVRVPLFEHVAGVAAVVMALLQKKSTVQENSTGN